jgi:hypothetical protein
MQNLYMVFYESGCVKLEYGTFLEVLNNHPEAIKIEEV